jgi:hypothetical protein
VCLAVGPVDRDERDALGGEVAGQAGAVRAGALDADLHELAVGTQPRQQLPVAGCGGRELPVAEYTPRLVDRGGVVGKTVSIRRRP